MDELKPQVPPVESRPVKPLLLPVTNRSPEEQAKIDEFNRQIGAAFVKALNQQALKGD